MALVVPTNSKLTLLQIIDGQSVSGDMQLHLFDNNVTVDTSTSKTILNEPSTDYTAKDLFTTGWTYYTPEPPAMEYPSQTFIFTTYTGTVYGYYVTLKTSGKLLWAENITPFTIGVPGDSISIIPRLEVQ